MIVYRTPTRVVNPCEVMNLPDGSPEGARSFLIHFGEIEAAMVDELCPDRDACNAEIEALRSVTLVAARQFVSGRADELLPRIRRAVENIDLPRALRVSVPEGYAYYGLFPETYAESARRFFEARHPAEVVCIGIRSIGTSLSAVVAAALEQRGARVYSWTVRPHGHPFDRELLLDEDLECTWRALSHAHFAIVDEGPGLSGSSFKSVAEKLASLGVPDRRIVFFPSWTPSGDQFKSDAARLRWRRHEKFSTEPQSGGCVDISAGKWRSIFYGDASEYPEIQPQHEARKYLCSSERGTALRKFAGLGLYGQAKLRNAQLLALNGFCPPAVGLDDGFLITDFVPGQPLSATVTDRHLLDRMAQYLAFRYERFAADSATPLDELAAMTEFNTGVRISPPEVHTRPCVVDGRMLPHDWIATPTGYLKTDALDHGDNHFYPGPTDIAWDLAGAISEFRMDDDAREYLIDAYMTHAGDHSIRMRLPFFNAAYLAFRIGYCTMNQIQRPIEYYRDRLEREVTASV